MRLKKWNSRCDGYYCGPYYSFISCLHVFLIALGLWFGGAWNIQAARPLLEVGSQEASKGAIIEVPVSLSNSQGVVEIGWNLRWDSDVLALREIATSSPVHAGILDSENFNLELASRGRLGIFFNQAIGPSLPLEAPLFSLIFEVVGTPGTISAIEFDRDGPLQFQLRFDDPDRPLSLDFIAGQVIVEENIALSAFGMRWRALGGSQGISPLNDGEFGLSNAAIWVAGGGDDKILTTEGFPEKDMTWEIEFWLDDDFSGESGAIVIDSPFFSLSYSFLSERWVTELYHESVAGRRLERALPKLKIGSRYTFRGIYDADRKIAELSYMVDGGEHIPWIRSVASWGRSLRGVDSGEAAATNFEIRTSHGRGRILYRLSVLDETLAHYPFDGSTAERSRSNLNLTGDSLNLGTDPFGQFGSAVVFDGGNYLYGPTEDDLFQSRNPESFSVTFWMYMDQPKLHVILSSYDASWRDSVFPLHIRTTLDGMVATVRSGNLDANAIFESDLDLITGAWHQVGYVFDKHLGEIRVFLDGMLRDQDEIDPTRDYTDNAPFRVAKDRSFAGLTDSFDGRISDLTIVRRALDEKEIRLMWEQRGLPSILIPLGRDENLKMMRIPSGSFVMGSPIGEGDEDEQPETQVEIRRPFWIGAFEVSQREYLAVIGDDPSTHKGKDRPVESISWAEAQGFCDRLNQLLEKSDLIPAGYEFRLPTEAEWEYSTRAGSESMFFYGDDSSYSLLGDYARYFANSLSPDEHAAVGQKRSNLWGIHDLYGNVAEWCSDWYQDSLPGGSVSDPIGPSSGDSRSLRGGASATPGWSLRSAARSGAASERSPKVGFRAVLGPILDESLSTVFRNPANGHDYILVELSESWAEARESAFKMRHNGKNGHLATVTTQEEFEFLAGRFAKFEEGSDYWLGGFRSDGALESTGGWQWITGETFDFEAWDEGGVSNLENGKSFVLHMGKRGWNVVEDAAPLQLGYLVEFEDSVECLTIVRHPMTQTADEGDSVAFDSFARRNDVQYQWFHNNEPLLGQNESTLLLQDVELQNEGFYHVVISSPGCDPVASEKAGLTVVIKKPDVYFISNSSGVEAMEIDEGAGNLSLEVVNDGRSDVVVGYLTEVDSEFPAIPGVDFAEVLNGRVMIPKGKSREIPIQIYDDYLPDGDKFLSVQLSVIEGDATISDRSRLGIKILDNDPDIEPDSFKNIGRSVDRLNNAITVVYRFESGAPLDSRFRGGWRLPWQKTWQKSEDSLFNLLPGTYPILFRSEPGFRSPEPITVTIQGGEDREEKRLIDQIYRVEEDMPDQAVLTMRHSSEVNGAQLADASFQVLGVDRKYSFDVLQQIQAAGLHIIEFDPVDGWIAPSSLVTRLMPGIDGRLEASYSRFPTLISTDGNLPRVARSVGSFQDYNSEWTLSGFPYPFVGEVVTRLGTGSGVVVDERVVLTAAHLLYDRVRREYVDTIEFFPARYPGHHESAPRRAEGFHAPDEYKSSVDSDQTAVSPSTRKSDYAALYFSERLSPEGSVGFLVSTNEKNWLMPDNAQTDSLMMLLGYPAGSGNSGNQNKTRFHINGGHLAATSRGELKFTSLAGDNSLLKSDSFVGFPGMSGGPLVVSQSYQKDPTESPRNVYFPAGIYLGIDGDRQIVRVIDLEVADLVLKAKSSASFGTDFLSTGVAFVGSRGRGESLSRGIQLILEPEEILSYGGGWKLALDGPVVSSTSLILGGGSGEELVIYFEDVPGWNAPSDAQVTLPTDHLAIAGRVFSYSRDLNIEIGEIDSSSISLVASGLLPGEVVQVERSSNLIAWEPLVIDDSAVLIQEQNATSVRIPLEQLPGSFFRLRTITE